MIGHGAAPPQGQVEPAAITPSHAAADGPFDDLPVADALEHVGHPVTVGLPTPADGAAAGGCALSSRAPPAC
ncbi:hypothetical protein ABTY98_03320 [Streptomyces sp. NPDC096040]|uniref:hypothetical protein n=1 Tax=Streptomyces sp. NPDC096040 TaxID=3155541 RepID=UPI00331AF462